MEEYKMLRQEILDKSSQRHTTLNLLFVGVTAMLGFGIDSENSLMILLSFCVIIPTYLYVIDLSTCIKRMGAYLEVFHEEYLDFKWEARQSSLYKDKNVTKGEIQNAFVLPFYLLSIVSFVLFLVYFDFGNVMQGFRVCELILAFIFAISMVFLAKKYKNIGNIKNKYVIEWGKVKAKADDKDEGK